MKLDRLFIPILYNSSKTGKKITNNLNIKEITREELLVERITYITKIALGEELNNMLGIEVDKDFNEAILQASIKAAKVGMKFADEHPRWISVEDELPKDSCYILVASRGIVHQWRYGVLESADVLKNMYGITHWMPLPVPPTCSEKPNNSKKGD